MILNIPNSGVLIPSEWDGDEKIEKEMLNNTEWFAEQLFGGDKLKSVIFPYSHTWCNAGEDDDSRICMKTTRDGKIFRMVSKEEEEYILKEFYNKHFSKLEEMIREEIEDRGFSFVIDCRTFSSGDTRADVCIGVDRKTPRPILKEAKRRFKSDGFSVQVRKSNISIGKKDKYSLDTDNLYVMRISINRDLYLDTDGKKPKIKASEFRKIYTSISALIKRLENATNSISMKKTA